MYGTSFWCAAILLIALGCDDGMTALDGGSDAGSIEPSIVAEFDGASFELPESVAFYDGEAYVSFLNGAVVRVSADGTVSSFGAVTIDPPGSAYALGVAVNASGDVFVAMAKASAESAFAAGVYRIPATGGEAALFASHPALYLPNDLDIAADGTIYVTADGAIFRATGADAEIWIDDPLLASGDGTVCGPRTSPFPIGANGIEVEASRVVVGNTEAGSLVAIPIVGGAAGAPTTIATELCGIDGLVGDGDGYLASVLGRRVVRVGETVTVLHEGLPLRTPAGIDVGTFGGARRAIVSSPDFEHAFGEGGPASAMPALVAIPL